MLYCYSLNLYFARKSGFLYVQMYFMLKFSLFLLKLLFFTIRVQKLSKICTKYCFSQYSLTNYSFTYVNNAIVIIYVPRH